MDFRITVETTFDNGEKRTHQLDGISRPYRVTCPDGIGLRLEDGKRIVEQIQRVILCDQVDEIIRESRVCPDCASVRAIHDCRTRDLDTLFGRVRVKAARRLRLSDNGVVPTTQEVDPKPLIANHLDFARSDDRSRDRKTLRPKMKNSICGASMRLFVRR